MLKKDGQPKPHDLHSFEQRWPNILPIVKTLINQQSINKCKWQDLFYDLHMICSWDERGCQKLLTALKEQILHLFIIGVKKRLATIEDGQQQLKEYIDYWTDYCGLCSRFPVAFQQLDLAIKNSTKYRITSTSIVRMMMLKLWKEHIVIFLSPRLQESAMQLLLAERNGRIIESRLIIGLRHSFIYLDDVDDHQIKYTPRYDMIYLEEIERFYLARANEQLKENGVLHYIVWASTKLMREEHRAELYFESSPKAIAKVKETCTNVLIKNAVEQILIECASYIRANDTGNMRIIFLFVDKVPGCAERFLLEFGNHIVTTGFSYLSSSTVRSNCEVYVQKLIECYEQFDEVLKLSFHNDSRAKTAMNKAFEFILNDHRVFQSDMNSATKASADTRCPEMVANYCDLLLRRTTISRKLSADDINDRLDKIVVIIRLIKNKEAFIKIHKIHLTKRLILDATINSEIEEQFIHKLKDLPGMPTEYTSKLTRMFKDLKSSEEILMQYKKSLQSMFMTESVNNNNNNTIQNLTSQMANNLTTQDNNNKSSYQNLDITSVKILNPSAWTKANDKFSIHLPNEISSTIPSIETFYSEQYSGRQLEWCHQLSNGTITFTTNKGKFDIDISAAQLAVLMAYNDQLKEEMTLKELESLSNLNSAELKRTLWSLAANPKFKIQLMNCNPKLNNIKDLDKENNKYSINHDFALIKNGKPQYKGRFNLIGRVQI